MYSVMKYRDGFCGIVKLTSGLQGKRRRKYFYAKTRGDAEGKCLAFLAQSPGLAELSGKDTKLGDLADSFLASKCRGEKPLRPAAEANYRYLINKLIKPIIGDMLVAKLEDAHIEEWLGQLKKGGWARTDKDGKPRLDPQTGKALLEKPKSAKGRHAACVLLDSLLTYARQKKIIAANPMEFVKRPSPKDKVTNYLEQAEILQFLGAINDEDQFPLFYFAIYSGMRIGEVLALQWEDVDFAQETIRVQHTLMEVERGTVTLGIPCGDECGCGAVDGRGPVKTRAGRRTLKLTQDVVRVLRRQQERLMVLGLRASPWVFPSSVGTPQIQRNVARLLARLLKKAGIKKHVSLHGLRHSLATLLITLGAHPKVVQDRIGHSDSSMMDRYVHRAPEHEAQIAERLAGFFAGV